MKDRYLERFYARRGRSRSRTRADVEPFLFCDMRQHGLHYLSAPLTVGLKITDRCNLDCSFCFSDNRGTGELPASAVRYIVDECLRPGPYRVYLTGGEPFLHPEALDVVAAIKSRNISLSIHTNGLLVTPALTRSLAGMLGKDDWVQVSLDAHTPELLSSIRKGAVLGAVVAGIRELVSSGIMVRTNTVVSNRNLGCLAEIYRLAATLGITQTSYSPLLDCRRDGGFQLPSDEDVLGSFSEVLKLHYRSGQPVRIGQNPVAVPWGNSKLGPIYRGRPLVCPAARTAVEIDPQGTVYPCPFLHREEWSMGNVLTDDWDSIWHHAHGRVGRFRQATWGTSSVCTSCANYSECGGGCLAAAFILGTEYDPRCQRAAGSR